MHDKHNQGVTIKAHASGKGAQLMAFYLDHTWPFLACVEVIESLLSDMGDFFTQNCSCKTLLEALKAVTTRKQLVYEVAIEIMFRPTEQSYLGHPRCKVSRSRKRKSNKSKNESLA